MTERDTTDLEALHGQHVEVVDVDFVEDTDGIPSWIKVEREMASVVISPRLLTHPTSQPVTPPSADREGTAPRHRREGVAS
ncbi:hypothetical protein [Agromyces sp. SYSU T00266]|uniref:hypothetical protein n=1 Tax=Agromyces zhanjiangensis TaxID=3158562 RepID=UPI003391FC44